MLPVRVLQSSGYSDLRVSVPRANPGCRLSPCFQSLVCHGKSKRTAQAQAMSPPENEALNEKHDSPLPAALGREEKSACAVLPE